MYFSLTGFIDCQYKLKKWHGCGCICKNVPVLRHRPFVFSSAFFLFHSVMKGYVNGSHFNLEITMRKKKVASGVHRQGLLHHIRAEAKIAPITMKAQVVKKSLSLASTESARWLHHLFLAARGGVGSIAFTLPLIHSS